MRIKLHPFQREVLKSYFYFSLICIVISLLGLFRSLKDAIFILFISQLFLLLTHLTDFLDENSTGNVRGINPFKKWNENRKPITIISEGYTLIFGIVSYFILVYMIILKGWL